MVEFIPQQDFDLVKIKWSFQVIPHRYWDTAVKETGTRLRLSALRLLRHLEAPAIVVVSC